MSDTWFWERTNSIRLALISKGGFSWSDAFQTSDCDQLVIQSVTKKVGDKFLLPEYGGTEVFPSRQRLFFILEVVTFFKSVC